ncbi:MAG: NUDIX hydrolase [bacterium]
MIYQKKPKDFSPKFEAAGNFVQCNGEIIVLHRHNHKPQGDTWGIPSGKIHEGESPLDTTYRETMEETGLVIPRKEIQFFLTVYVTFPDYDFVYHIFHALLIKKAKIIIRESEHKDAQWISPKDALTLPLIEDLDSCIKLFFGI